MMIWTILNVMLCVGIFLVCSERLRMTTRQTLWLVRWAFAILGTAAVAWAVSPLFWPLVTPPLRVVFSFGVALHLLSHADLWRGSTPRELHHGGERRTGDQRRVE